MDATIVLEGGGQLTVREEGPRVRLEVWRRGGAGIYKVWLRGARGRMLLGTLAPELGGLSLVRRLSRQSLERAGCWPITGGETVLVQAMSQPSVRWEQACQVQELLRDPILRRCAGEVQGLLLRRTGEGFDLAAPYDPFRPFPMEPLFCLAGMEQVQGAPYVVFSFDEEGRPRCFGLPE